MSKSVTYPRFISNLPCGDDLFESKSQERTAKQIAEHITAGDKDYQLIGLDGEWGSGKSNAISIVRKQLEKKHHLFIYDTWAHQEDLQRRSFLEELTDDLQKNHIVDQVEWRTRLNDLLAKKKVTITKTIPRLSYAIIASLLVAILTPLTKVISDEVPDDKPIYKFLIAAAPLMIAIGVWIIAALRDKQLWNITQLFSIYEKQDLQKITDETISENEPSVREFRNWMHQLDQASNKKIVIVFDNMDRLPSEKIKIIWALLHTFFSAGYYSNIWVIVPFDRSHVRQAFEKDGGDNNFEKTNHFINKTFSVIFTISPAVLTDWKKFFEIKFKDAFGEEEKAEFIIARKIFDLHHASITPRKIIAFLNDIVSQKMIWREQIKLRYIATFVLNRQEIAASPLFEIFNKKFLGKAKGLFAGDDTVSNNIAALLYNIPLEKAAQVALQREIEITIRERRIDDLKKMADSPDFISILEQLEVEDIDIEATTICLNEIQKALPTTNEDSFQVIWDRIIGSQLATQIQAVEFTEIHKILIQQSRPEQRKYFVAYLLKGFSGASEFAGSRYFSALSGIEEFLKVNNFNIDYLLLVKPKQLSPEQFLDYLDKAGSNYKKYKASSASASVEEYLLNKTPGDLANASVIQHLKDEFQFTELKHKIESTINNKQVTLQNVYSLFATYSAVSPELLLSAKLQDQQIYDLLAEAEEDSNEYNELATMRIARANKFANNGPAMNTLLSVVDDDYISAIYSRIQCYADYGGLLVSVCNWQKPALQAVLKKMILSSNGQSLRILEILSRFSQIAVAVGVSKEDLLKDLNRWVDSLRDQLTIDYLKSAIPDEEFYKDALSIECELSDLVLKIAVKYVEQESEDHWNEAFKGNDPYLLNVLNILLPSDKIVEFPQSLFAAYKTALKAIADGDDDYDISNVPHGLWDMLFVKCDKSHLQATVKDIRDIFLRDSKILETQFLFFEPMLRELGGLQEWSGEVVRKILTSCYSSTECLEILVANKDYYSSLIDKAGDDALEFIDIIRGNLEKNTGNTLLKEFSTKIDEELAENITISYVDYFSPDRKSSGSDKIPNLIKRKIEKGRMLHFLVDNNMVDGDDPHVGELKRLHIKYIYKGEKKEKIVTEGNWMSLP
ncbi:P-loop NTPase fold protein [Lacibacter sp. H375]|uniref:P-loop NTPase fold protein n=1 Tax=Lacibacter sp. H375 TaxID=3133424 RepID=UPI0030C4A645